MSFSKKSLFMLAVTATASAYALTGAYTLSVAQTAAPAAQPVAATPAPAAANAVELDTIESFSDTVYERRRSYFGSVKQEIAFKADKFPAALRTEYSETFRDFEEKEPRRTNWMLPTDTGWVSAGGADLYDVHLDLE